HIRRMRLKYQHARDEVVDQIQQCVPGLANVTRPSEGMHLVVQLTEGLSDVVVAREAMAEGIVTRPLSPMFIEAPPQSALLLGFAGYEPAQLRRSVNSLARVMMQVH